MALILSIVLHTGIILLTTAGQGEKISSGPISEKLQVHIITIPPPVKNAPQPQEKSRHVLETPVVRNESDTPGAKGAIAIAEDEYYRVKELDVVPQPASLITPIYPKSTPSFIKHGIVKLELKLNENGIVTNVTVISSDPPGYFEDAARQAFLEAKFTPGIKSGQKVKSLLTLQVHFETPRMFDNTE